MKLKFLLIPMLFLTACGSTDNSAIEVVCGLDLPTVSHTDTQLTLNSVDTFSEQFRRACEEERSLKWPL
jgi:hypothetical protein